MAIIGAGGAAATLKMGRTGPSDVYNVSWAVYVVFSTFFCFVFLLMQFYRCLLQLKTMRWF